MAKTLALTASTQTTQNDITVYRGEAATLTFTMTPVVDITGWLISMVVKRKWVDSSALLNMSGTVTNGPNGVFTVDITNNQIKTTLGVGLFAYDVQRTTSGSETVLSIGRFVVKQSSLGISEPLSQ